MRRALLLALLVLFAGCVSDKMAAQAVLEEVNCTHSKIHVIIKVKEPMEITLNTARWSKSFFVEGETTYDYLIENKFKTERVLVIAENGETFERIIGLPECACMLVDLRAEWNDPNMTYILTGIYDSEITIDVMGQSKKVNLSAGEVKEVPFTLSIPYSTIVNSTVTAKSWCTQEFGYSVIIEKPVISSGSVEYVVGENVHASKEFQLEGVVHGFAFLVGSAENLTVRVDGKKANFTREANAITIRGSFKTLSLEYDLEPEQQRGRYILSDQVMSADSITPVDVRVSFVRPYVPYYLNVSEFSVTNTNPVELVTSTNSYRKVVNLGYGPEKVRINILVQARITARSDTAAKLEILLPKDTALQKIEAFELSPATSSTREEYGETYYIYTFPEIEEGKNESVSIRITALRKAAVYPTLPTPLQQIGKALPYWEINEDMEADAEKLVGEDEYETIYNVVNFVRDRTNYTENYVREGAIATYVGGEGACDDFTDTVIGMLRYLGIPAAYVSGYAVQPAGDAPAGSHAWMKVLAGNGVEVEPQESFGAIDPFRVEMYSEYGDHEKSRYWVYGNVTFSESLTMSYEYVT